MCKELRFCPAGRFGRFLGSPQFCFALHAVGDVEDATVEILGTAILAIDGAAAIPYPFCAAALVNDPVFDREWRMITDRLFDGAGHTVAIFGIDDAREAAWTTRY